MNLHQGAATLTQDPMVPRTFKVIAAQRELADTVTLDLVATDGTAFDFAPGQFNMLYKFGTGEVPISISGAATDTAKLVHTIRAVGLVSTALTDLAEGDVIGIRGPFGTGWPVEIAKGRDVVFVAGGLGLAPLRPAIYAVLADRAAYGAVSILYGARTPDDLLFEDELHSWRGRFDIDLDVIVDRAEPGWTGNVGVVTSLVDKARFDASETVALVCGPEIMMRFAVKSLTARGVDEGDIYVSMERNMQCALGFCGHCQFGGGFVCKDGPVYAFDRIGDIFNKREI